jgi:hypothetical protein
MLSLRVDDYLVKSVLKCLQLIVPASLYDCLIQDFYEVLVKAAGDDQKGCLIHQDQLAILMGLI